MASSTGHPEHSPGPGEEAEQLIALDRPRLRHRLGWLAMGVATAATAGAAWAASSFFSAVQVLNSGQVGDREATYLRHVQENAFMGGVSAAAIAGFALASTIALFRRGRSSEQAALPETPTSVS